MKAKFGAVEYRWKKNRFQDAYPDSFRRLLYLRSLSLRFYAAKKFSQMFLTLCFSFARGHGTFQQVAENSIQAFLRGCEAKSSWQVHQNCRG